MPPVLYRKNSLCDCHQQNRIKGRYCMIYKTGHEKGKVQTLYGVLQLYPQRHGSQSTIECNKSFDTAVV